MVLYSKERIICIVSVTFGINEGNSKRTNGRPSERVVLIYKNGGDSWFGYYEDL